MTGTLEGEHGRHRVVRINPDTQKVETFFSRKEGLTAGPRRLLDVVFSPDGEAMYVVDFGAMVVEKEPKPFPGSGLVWRITRDGTTVEGPPANLSLRHAKGDQR